MVQKKSIETFYFLFLTKNFFRDADATQVFHAFHEGSKSAYKQLELLKKRNCIGTIDRPNTING